MVGLVFSWKKGKGAVAGNPIRDCGNERLCWFEGSTGGHANPGGGGVDGGGSVFRMSGLRAEEIFAGLVNV